MASAPRTTNASRPRVTLMYMDSIIIHVGERGISSGEIRQLNSSCQVNLLREELGRPLPVATPGGIMTYFPPISLSSSGGNSTSKQNDPRKSQDKKKPSNMEVSSKQKRGETGPSKLVASRRSRNISRFDCLFCGKVFSGPSGLERHLRTHTKEKPFFCATCGSAFALAGDLKNHVAVRHDHAPKRYECGLCSMRFYRRSDLNEHIRRHLGEKPHRCDVCQKAFVTDYELGYHKAIHRSVRPFKCAKCGDGFKLKSGLRNHQRTCLNKK